MAKNFPADPDNKGSVLCWAVLQETPVWKLSGVYETEEAARQAASTQPGYGVFYGSHQVGTDNFIHLTR